MGRLMKALVGFLVALVALGLSSTRALGDQFYQANDTRKRVPGGDGAADNNARRAGLQGVQRPASASGVVPIQGENRAALNGTPTISDTFKPQDQGTDWPADAFTALVMGHQGPDPISHPALHSYDGDGNMEAISVFPPFNQQENRTDLATYTGAVGPAGGSTPEGHPELTAP
jgi:hypothetical protein